MLKTGLGPIALNWILPRVSSPPTVHHPLASGGRAVIPGLKPGRTAGRRCSSSTAEPTTKGTTDDASGRLQLVVRATARPNRLGPGIFVQTLELLTILGCCRHHRGPREIVKLVEG